MAFLGASGSHLLKHPIIQIGFGLRIHGNRMESLEEKPRNPQGVFHQFGVVDVDPTIFEFGMGIPKLHRPVEHLALEFELFGPHLRRRKLLADRESGHMMDEGYTPMPESDGAPCGS